MKTFLAEVAERIYREHGDSMDTVAVVFNNRRPGLFLNRELMRLSDKPIFLPQMLGMDDMVSLLCGLKIVPSEFLLFELYNVHRQVKDTVHRYETFEDFITFGELMLHDFSEIDLYRVDAAQLFSNLHELKSIGEWDVSGAPLTEFQKRYLSFYRSLYQYYDGLRTNLLKTGQAYGGMAYRMASDVVSIRMEKIPYSHVYFVGFNALSASEQGIVEAFVRAGRGTLITDGDAYYFDDERQEAGRFLRRQAERFPVPEGYADHFAMQEKHVNIVSCSENVLQTKYAAQRLSEFADEKKGDFDQTAVVLADEKLLEPMLNAIPEEIDSVNVTIGFPFPYSMTNTLVTKFLELHSHARKGGFYYKDVVSLLSDRLFAAIAGTCFNPSQIEDFLESEHTIYVDWEMLKGKIQPMGSHIDDMAFAFAPEANSADGMLTLWERCIELLSGCDSIKGNAKEFSSLSCWKELTDYFVQLQKKYHYIDSLSVLQKLYQRLSKRHNVAFIGEPLAGLQLLGMLETRNLDFQRIILLSVNEGILPSGRSANTLIPYSLKVGLGIPTYRDKDAVYANHFYNLLQRAEEVDLVFSTDADAMGKGEPSRFVLQVRDELALRYPNIKVENKVVLAEHNVMPKGSPYKVEKTAAIMQKIMLLSEKGLSPSALNLYRHCSLEYYYKYVLGVKELESFAEEVDASDLGTCVHDILMKIYEPKTDGLVSAERLKDALGHADEYVQEWFEHEMGTDSYQTGRNRLSAEVAKSQLKRFLQLDIDNIESGNKIQINAVEFDMSYPLEIGIGECNTAAKIIGKADRIDCVNGVVRIADYKTGTVTQSDVTMTEKKASFPDKWFQVMLYAWLYWKNQYPDFHFQAGIIPLRSYKPDFMPVSWFGNTEITDETLRQFEGYLKECIETLLDPHRPFEPIESPKSNDCTYCPMNRLCALQRQK